jgi:hypothetical protein
MAHRWLRLMQQVDPGADGGPPYCPSLLSQGFLPISACSCSGGAALKKDWLTVPKIDHAIVGYLCLLIGFAVGMKLGQHLDGDGFLTLAGGAGGAVAAVLGAIYVEQRGRRRDRGEDRAALIEAVELALFEIRTVHDQCQAGGNVHERMEAALQLSVVAERTVALTEQALLHAKTIKLSERVKIARVDAQNRVYIQQFKNMTSTLHDIAARMPATAEHNRAMEQVGGLTSFASKLRDMMIMLRDALLGRRIDS